MSSDCLKRLYFVENFHGIQYFLSVVSPDDDGVVVTSGDPVLGKFLDEAIPSVKRLVIPRVPSRRFFLHPFFLLWWRIKYSRILRSHDVDEAVFFGHVNNLHFFSTFKGFIRRGVCLRYIDSWRGRFFINRIKEKSVLRKLYNAILSAACGIEIARFQGRIFQVPGWSDPPIPDTIEALSWCQIAEKFGFPTEKINDAVLLIDGPIHAFPGIDYERSVERVVDYLKRHVKRKIHLKQHLTAGRHSFEGHPFEAELELAPRHIPAELLILRYNEIYFFSSNAGCADQGDARRFSLAKLLVFDSDDSEKAFWDLFSDYFKNDDSIILCEL